MEYFAIIYHVDNDGLLSAALVKDWIKTNTEHNEVDLIPAQYGDFTAESLLERIATTVDNDGTIWMVDWSLPLEEMEKLRHLQERFIWVDHHDTAYKAKLDSEILCNYKGSVEAVELIKGFKTKRAACELVWEFLYNNRDYPQAVELVGNWDSWRWKNLNLCPTQESRQTKAFNAWTSANVSASQPSSVDWFIEALNNDSVVSATIAEGIPILARREAVNKSLASSMCFEIEVLGHKGLAINRAGNSLLFESVFDLEKHSFMMTFSLTASKKWRISVYSEDETFRCDNFVQILANMGPYRDAGGHVGAAGFQTDFDTLSRILDLV